MQFCRRLENFQSFNQKRVKCLVGNTDLCLQNNGGVAYYMHRDQRLQDNWSTIYAQNLAINNSVPLHVIAGVNVKYPIDSEATRRTLDFSLGGLQEVEVDCKKNGIEFHLLHDLELPMYQRILQFIERSNTKCIVVDFSPLKPHRNQIQLLAKEMHKICGCYLFQVDSHNIVPVWEASNIEEPRATEMRQKIMLKFDNFFTEFPKVQLHPVKSNISSPSINWDEIKSSLAVDESVTACNWAKPGCTQGLIRLQQFIDSGLKNYNEKRNDPTINAISNLSPWLHFGQISAQRAVIEVFKHNNDFPSSVSKFIDEAVVWSEMSDNYCLYNDNYDNLEGAPSWAIETLTKHKNTKREYVYSKEQFDNAETHDKLWNAAQVQLKREGKMHGYMRMYWAKKMLEWTNDPDEAIKYAIFLNDHYSLDGADSNGYAGVMWSIAGVHDPPKWGERPIYGKIRYMSYNGAKGKFDIFKYISKFSTSGDEGSSSTIQNEADKLDRKTSYHRKGNRVQGGWGCSNLSDH